MARRGRASHRSAGRQSAVCFGGSPSPQKSGHSPDWGRYAASLMQHTASHSRIYLNTVHCLSRDSAMASIADVEVRWRL